MSKIQVFKDTGEGWSMTKPEAGKTHSATAGRIRFMGSESEPQLAEVKVFPNEQVEVHAHETGEFFYIVKGEMHFGQHVLHGGDSIYIPGGVLYSFKAGVRRRALHEFPASARPDALLS